MNSACSEQLRVNCQDHPVLLAESSAVSKDTREKVTEHMFESFHAPAIFLAKNAVLSSFALGRQTSLVLDIGYEGAIGALSWSTVHRAISDIIMVCELQCSRCC
jgi:actin-related protein